MTLDIHNKPCEFEILQPETLDTSIPSSFEKVLEDVGSEHRYQKILLFAFMIPVALSNCMGSANITLLLTTPEHSCHVSGRFAMNASLAVWKNLTIPWEEDTNTGIKTRSSCSMYDISPDELSNFLSTVDDSEKLSSDLVFANRSVIECQNGWDFDDSSWSETPVSKFEWVCDKKHYVTQIFSLFFAANGVGTFLFSVISDRYGRKKSYFFLLTLSIISSVSSIFSSSLAVFSALKFILGLAYYSMYTLPYIVVIELCSENYRNLASVSTFLACVAGNSLISLFAHFAANWKSFTLLCHLPPVVFFLFLRFFPESPRWLLSRFRVAECEEVLKRIATTNQRSYSETTRSHLLKAQMEETKRGSLRNILTARILLKRLIVTSILMGITYILYYAMALNIHNMSGSKVLNFFILTLIEIPGNVFGSLCAQYGGRRLSLVIFNGIAGLCSLLVVFVVADQIALLTLCALVKLSATAETLILFMIIGELFPTPLRSTAFGITGVFGISTVILMPPLMALGSSNVFLPYYTLSGISFLGLVLASILPETLGLSLPQTVLDAELIGQTQSFFSIIHKWNVHKYKKTSRDTCGNENDFVR